MPVARDAGGRLDDGGSAADDSVEQGGFTHIGPADDGDQRVHGDSIDLAGKFGALNEVLEPADNGFRKGLPIPRRGQAPFLSPVADEPPSQSGCWASRRRATQ